MHLKPGSKIFVTGGNGFIGSRLLQELIDKGYSVRCLLRKSSKTERIEHLEYESAYGDLLEPESLEKGMEGCDGVVHLAAIANWADIHSPMMRKVVINGTRNILSAALKNNKLPTVYVSSAAAVNGSLEPEIFNEASTFELPAKGYTYACAKHEAEGVCKEFVEQGLPVVTVNPAEVYGPQDMTLVTSTTLIAFANSPTAMASKGGTSIVHVNDVALGIIAALEKGRSGERYILGGDNLSFHELATLTLSILGMNKKVMTMPTAVIKFCSWLEGTFKINLGADPAVIPYALRYWYMDTSKAKDELGIHFRSPKEILEPTLAWLVEHDFINLKQEPGSKPQESRA